MARPQRLQKILAQAGVASRRAAESLITEGRVRVNGRIVDELGASAVAGKDKIEVDGRRVVLEKPVYFVMHKPRGMVSTLSDPEGRPHLGEVVGTMGARVYPVGRLDFHTSGVLLITNDGELTDALLHPRKDVPKVYVAKVRGTLGVPELDQLRNGVTLDDGHRTKPCEVFVLREEDRNTWIQITLYEGKNRQVHRMCDAIEHPCLRLSRTSFAGIGGEGLRPGQWRALNTRELDKLKKTWLAASRQAKDREALDADAPRVPKRRKGGHDETSPAQREGAARSKKYAARAAPTKVANRELAPSFTLGGAAHSPSVRSGRHELPSFARAERSESPKKSKRADRAPRGRAPKSDERAPRGRAASEERAPRGRAPKSDERAPRGRAASEERAPRGRGSKSDERGPAGRSGSRQQERAPRGRSASSDERAPRGRASEDRAPRGRSASSEDRGPRGRTSDERSPRGRTSDERSPRGRTSDERAPRGRAGAEDRAPRGRAGADDRAPRARSGSQGQGSSGGARPYAQRRWGEEVTKSGRVVTDADRAATKKAAEREAAKPAKPTTPAKRGTHASKKPTTQAKSATKKPTTRAKSPAKKR